MSASFDDEQAARALVEIVGTAPWEAVAFAAAFIALREGKRNEQAARIIFEQSQHTLTKSREIVAQLKTLGFLACLRRREKIGSAEAKALLESLANGAPRALETVSAKRSLERLRKGLPARPTAF